jgi:photosystem II stability/assembly factor-like uncharacterized protein
MKTRVLLLLGLTLAIAGQASGQWVQTSGPEGGYASALLNTGQSILLAAGTLYRSTDDGATWTPSAAGLGPHIGGIAALAMKGSTVYCGTGDDGIYRSTDDGITWKRSSAGIDGDVHIGDFSFNDSVMFATSESRGVFRSTDSGNSWVQVNNGLADTIVVAVLLRGADVYAATWDGGVFKSTNKGAIWNPVNAGLAGDGLRLLSLAGTSTSLIAGTRDGVYRSTDSGTTWGKATSGLTSGSVSVLFPSGSEIFAGTLGSGAYRSVDDGVHWAIASTGLDNLNIRGISGKGNSLFVGTYGGRVLYKSTNGGAQWTASGKGIVSSLNYAITALGGRVIAAVTDGIQVTTNNGDAWFRSDSGVVGQPAYSLWVRGSDVYLGTNGRGVYRSADSGVSWTPVDGGLSGAARIVWSLTDDGTALYAGTSGGVYRSTNNGGIWLPAKNGLTDSLTISLLATSGTLFAGTTNGLYRSTNQGTSWTAAGSGAPPHYVSALAGANSVIVAAMTSGAYRSTDNGDSWTPALTGIPPEGGIPSALLANGRNLFAGTGLSRAYLSSDAGLSWTDISSGLLKPGIGMRSMLAANGYLWAATTSSGVWKRKLSEVIVAVGDGKEDGIPGGLALFQNYPNPFNPMTSIQFSIEKSQFTILTVYDLFGREVATLVNERKAPGRYMVQFDGSGLASGVYFYRLQAGDFVQTRTLLLLR